MKKNIRKALCVILVLCLCMGLCACQRSNGAEQNKQTQNEADEKQNKQLRIVSGYYISTSVVLALGLSDSLVGVEAKADQRNIYRLSAPDIINLPNTGTAKSFDLEGCIALEPDLVILPKKLKEQGEKLKELGIDVLLVNPEDDDSLKEMIKAVAQKTGTEKRASELISYIETARERLEKKLDKVKEKYVYMAANSDYLSSCGGEMYQSELIDAAGGENVAENIKDSYWANISYEQLLAWNPEYIIIAAEAVYGPEEILADSALSDLRAVKEKKIYKMPGDIEAWDSPVPGSFLGAWWLGSILHENKVSSSDFNKEVSDFYKEFYGFEAENYK